ncbi:MAG: DUF4215 domain-containing protein [Myxococcales bacterium]|nr:DUF4215 domain-containing protein [Myxococcales bacterium]MCB9706743.1 DUF4215 domain-containing protein [Myxococcales bacterium]
MHRPPPSPPASALALALSLAGALGGCSDRPILDTEWGSESASSLGDPTSASAATSDGATCGDGQVDGDEECDDGNDVDTDNCTSQCKRAACGDGFVQPGEGCDDGNLASGDGCSAACVVEKYTAYGPQRDVPQAALGGWSECWSGPYGSGGTSLAVITASCTKAELMLACRRLGDPVFTLLAHAPRADVFFDTGNTNTPHVANGAGWYYSESWSWGFAAAGDPIERQSCDINEVNAPLRLCWHTGGGYLDGGWRCGVDTDLNSDDSWERVVLHAD